MEVPRHDFIIILIILMIMIVGKVPCTYLEVGTSELAMKEPQFPGLPDVASLTV